MITIPFVRLRRVWYALSALMIGGSIVALATFGLRMSIEFEGGSLIELKFAGPVPATADLTATVTAAGHEGAIVQSAGEQNAIVRLGSLDEAEHQALLQAIETAHGETDELRFDSINPSIGDELKQRAAIGVIVTLVLIGLYVAWAFRQVSEPIASWKYGLLTVFTAAHDVIVPLGVFAVLGHFYHWEIGSAFVAAILTILGYSISDTVVVFDRTRENLAHRSGDSFAEVVDRSIRQTFVRSVNTSITTLLALTAILVWGGETTRPFALALMIGIGIGTYSSIFIASPLLVSWEGWRSTKNA